MEEDILWIWFVLWRWSGFHGKEQGEKTSSSYLSHNSWLVREDRRRSSNPFFLLESFLGTPRSHRSLKGNDLRLRLLASLPVLPSHQHEIVRLLSGALGILGKQKTELNSLAMKMCKIVGDIFQDAVEYFFKRESFHFSCPFPSMACLQPQLIWSQSFQGVLSGFI